MKRSYELYCGDALRVLSQLPECSVDSVVTDPPYGIKFMGKKWDYDVPAVEVWIECLRVLKPGGYLLSFGGARTYHRLATRIEDAGFTLHPLIGWAFGSGFPKATRVDLPDMDGWRYGLQSLKPALEPICMAQKPFSEKTGLANIAKWGTGALNIDGCRVEGPVDGPTTPPSSVDGRWPANLIHDGSDEVMSAFPAAPGQQATASTADSPRAGRNVYGDMARGSNGQEPRGDSGSAARFFYCSKASKKDRNAGLDEAPDSVLARSDQAQAQAKRGITVQQEGGAFNKARVVKNNHPTVKPTDLMRYLCRLVTPPGGVVVDPYMGSGSTGRGAMLEALRFIGSDDDSAWLRLAEARILDAWQEWFDEQ